MIHKSYIVEEKINVLMNKIILIYGENLGLINSLKDKLRIEVAHNKVIKFLQDDLIKNPNLLINEIKNKSLFEEEKYIFIDEVSDKILKTLEQIEQDTDNTKIFLFAGLLEKRSKLRAHCEQSDKCDVVPCYIDNEMTIKKLILRNLKDFSGVTNETIDTLIQNVGLDRLKLLNELNKIKFFFKNKNIKIDQLNNLLNNEEENDFNCIKDSALNGKNFQTNKLLSSTVLEMDKIPLYLSIINQRLNRLKDLAILSKNTSENVAINNLKPPIFWKDKPNFLQQAKLWDLDKLNNALNKTYDFEIFLKSNSNLNKEILIRKLLVDICLLAKA